MPHGWKIMELSRIEFRMIERKTIRKSCLFPYKQSEWGDFTNFRAYLIGILSEKLEPEIAEITDLSRLTSWILIILNFWSIFTGEMSENPEDSFSTGAEWSILLCPVNWQLFERWGLKYFTGYVAFCRFLLKSCLHFLTALNFWESDDRSNRPITAVAPVIVGLSKSGSKISDYLMKRRGLSSKFWRGTGSQSDARIWTETQIPAPKSKEGMNHRMANNIPDRETEAVIAPRGIFEIHSLHPVAISRPGHCFLMMKWPASSIFLGTSANW
jgi:hypothetical protein